MCWLWVTLVVEIRDRSSCTVVSFWRKAVLRSVGAGVLGEGFFGDPDADGDSSEGDCGEVGVEGHEVEWGEEGDAGPDEGAEGEGG